MSELTPQVTSLGDFPDPRENHIITYNEAGTSSSRNSLVFSNEKAMTVLFIELNADKW
ncbi:MAG: hypothetical protein ACFFD4_39600 [Candidatus Odinarchaeota archaeon]